jgi:hypothetical protein
MWHSAMMPPRHRPHCEHHDDAETYFFIKALLSLFQLDNGFLCSHKTVTHPPGS